MMRLGNRATDLQTIGMCETLLGNPLIQENRLTDNIKVLEIHRLCKLPDVTQIIHRNGITHLSQMRKIVTENRFSVSLQLHD